MKSPGTWHRCGGWTAFTLIEMVVVIAILVILTAAGVNLIAGSGTQSRKAGTDLLAGLIDQARTAAITSRSYVVLAIAEPGDLPTDDERCRMGLFRVENWPENPTDPVIGVPMNRWRTLNSGIALIGGQVDGVDNPLDVSELAISYGTTKPMKVIVHALAFNPRGGLHYPAGSSPIVMRLAEGNYRNGRASAYKRGDAGSIAENRLKIGRVIARPYRIDG